MSTVPSVSSQICAAFLDDDHALLAIGLFEDAPIYRTQDGGETWAELTQLPLPEGTWQADWITCEASQVTMHLSQGEEALCLFSDDYGEHWTAEDSLPVLDTVADGTYCAPMPQRFPETDGVTDYERLELTLYEFDPEIGEQGALLGTAILPLAEKLTLQHADSETPYAAGAPGTQERDQRIVSFVFWPLLRSSYPADGTDWMEVQLQDGAVTSLRWFRAPGGNETGIVHPVTGEISQRPS